ncbi:integrating conjugative element membrane protein [Thioalkalivibrio denitrificans]|uniref:Integrating conjugative element membrane protein n=2 Tax=Thioalkalivibrio denitrificans TaxID=108003 RepID=A0A1V3NVA1_9GAMM|nr:integrating conjugative element membrane protein [Thioalkalivibrio denitrificans]
MFAVLGWLMLMAGPALAQGLPTPVAPDGVPADSGNWLAFIRGYIRDGAIVLGLALSVVALIWVAYTGLSKFNEARNGKAEWMEVGVTVVVGAVLLLFIMFLLNQAATIFA